MPDEPSRLPACPPPDPDAVTVHLANSDHDRLDAVYEFVREISPDDAPRFDDAQLLLLALEMAADQARDFVSRLARLRGHRCAVAGAA
ncbi:MAG: hypothetical protein DI601_13615 [Azospirillum brasilense]|nr:MAG: hypothetical protein DI601_13615 [Azospirillum brasilense]